MFVKIVSETDKKEFEKAFKLAIREIADYAGPDSAYSGFVKKIDFKVDNGVLYAFITWYYEI